MVIHVEKISESMVKPSCPTPHHLRHCQLSSLDQVMVGVFPPCFLFYPRKSNITNTERYQRVKKSLSQTLTLFYPFAGRVVGNSHIDCNDEGVPLVEAKVRCAMLQVLQTPYCNHLNKLIPLEVDETTDLIAFAQVTYFDCGGMSVGIGLSHKIADASSLITFLNTWAAVARGDSNVSVPRFDTAKYFPPINVLGFDPSFEIVHGEHNLLMRKYLFNAISLAVLQDRYTDKRTGTGDHRRPTRTLALTTFIWERFLAATQTKPAPDTVYVLRTPINLRSRMEPPLPRRYIGNFVYEPMVAVLDNKAMDSNSGTRVINQMRETIRSVDKEFVKRLEDGEEHLKIMQDRAEALGSGQEVPLTITSCLFPVYETDFEWGKPLSVSLGRWPYDNLVLLIPAKEADGIQVYLSFKKEDMFKLERDPEINALASPNHDFHVSLM